MTFGRKVEIGVLVTVALALIGFAFWLGGLERSVAQLDPKSLEQKRKQILDEFRHEASLYRTAPLGTIVAFASTTAKLPDGWALCDGAPVPDGKDYDPIRELLAGASWGDEKGKPRLPDLRGQFLRGVDDPDGEGGTAPAGQDKDASDRTHPITGNRIGGLVGSQQADATARPHVPFVTSGAGKHKHVTVVYGADRQSHFGERGLGKHPGSYSSPGFRDSTYNGPLTSEDGEHSHKIGQGKDQGSGGDKETRPANAYVNWIIKIRD